MQITGAPMAWEPKPTETAVGSSCYTPPNPNPNYKLMILWPVVNRNCDTSESTLWGTVMYLKS